jgi:dethiobiotin synthetase
MHGLFVTGTDTDVGKSVLSASLLAAMAAAGERVRAHKPVLSGLDDTPGNGADAHGSGADRLGGAGASGDPGPLAQAWPADDELLGAAAGMPAAEVTQLRYGPAVSPHFAAELEGRPIDPSELVKAARAQADGATMIVEGVGGLLVPLTDDYSVCDLALALGLPMLIAARPGLGTINHSLLTLRVARAAGLSVRAVVLTPWPVGPTPMELSNRDTIARVGEVEVQTLARVASADVAALARAGEGLPWRQWLGRPATR